MPLRPRSAATDSRPARAVWRGMLCAGWLIGAGIVTAMAADRELLGEAAAPRLEWRSIDDVVMGGVSSSAARTAADGVLRFSGTVSLENNGGFASIRSEPVKLDLGAAQGLRLRVKGGDKRFKLNLKTDAEFDTVQYQAPFTAPQEWATVTLPFSAFKAVFRGRPVPGAPTLDPARIETLGFLISDRQEGPFLLEISSITVYTSP